MQQHDYCQRHGGTMACVVRGIIEVTYFKHHPDVNIEVNDNTSYLFLGDS